MIDIGKIDWNEEWKRSGPGQKGSRGSISCLGRWSDPKRCRKYDKTAKADNWGRSWARIRAMKITPASRVLDIGAGPGTLAVPLSGLVRHVTAIEPSAGMAECLMENIRASDIRNIRVLTRKWEDLDISTDLDPPYDIVVASYSLGFPDLRDALLKMNDASEKYVYIFWFADMQSPWRRNYGEIWEHLFGVPNKEPGRPNIIFNLLNQLGIYANVEISKEAHITSFSSIDEAVADQGAGLGLTTKEQESILREFLTQKLQPDNGSYLLRGTSYQAKIWWEKEG